MTLDDWNEIARRTIVTQRRAAAASLEARAEKFASGDYFAIGVSKETLLADAAIARWEADTLERDGKLPDEYLALLDDTAPVDTDRGKFGIKD